MNEMLNKFLKSRNVGVGALASALGISRQSVYRKLESDMRMSSLIKVVEASGCYLCIYDPVTKKKTILREDNK